MKERLVLNAAETRVVQKVAEHETAKLRLRFHCIDRRGRLLLLNGSGFIFGLLANGRALRVVIFLGAGVDFAIPAHGVLTCLLIELALHQHVKEVADCCLIC